ncbi:unnamed protein product [Porites evermanni]|uniref:SH3 and PX domain-containing protein 2A n=1 Tax=Porites evermanni TaxID=104178 RepID=A0ABN8LE57_9CNID|nr:unnamed protein product [Porites evermanni]
MRQSPTNEKGAITDVKVVDVEKRKTKDSGSAKNYEYELKVTWSDENQYNIFRRYSMFFDLQAGLKNLFQERQNSGLTIPELPVTRFAGGMLFGAFSKKQCKNVEEFCQRVIHLPYVVSQSDIVLAFFSRWGTDHAGMLRNDIERNKPQTSPTRNDEQVVEKYYSVAEFSGSGRGEMSLKENEVVTVIEKNSTGWWLVANSRGDHGFAPATFLEPMDTYHRLEEEEWREVEEDDRYWVALESYNAKSEDELSYRGGEEVEVLATSNFGWWKIRLRGEVGLTPGSNLTPKPRLDDFTDSLMTEEQRQRVDSYSSNNFRRFLHSTLEQENWLQLLLQEQGPVQLAEPVFPTDRLQNRSQPDRLDLSMGSSYSSISHGIYASIRSPPPRRDSSKTKKDLTEPVDDRRQRVMRSQSTPYALEYATVEVLPSQPIANRNHQFNFQDVNNSGPEYASVIPKHLRARPRGRSLSEEVPDTRPMRSGSPELPPPPPSVLVNSYVDPDDPGYTRVMERRQLGTTVSPRVQLLTAPDGEMVKLGSRKYQNVPRGETHIPGEHYVSITNYSPTAERPEDLPLTTGETVRLLTEDGAWAFVCTLDQTRRRGWVPSSILKKKGGIPLSQRSKSLGDIFDASQEEEAVAPFASVVQRAMPVLSSNKPPVPTPRNDMEIRRTSVDYPPTEPAPPLPGAPPNHIFKPGKVNAHYFAKEDFTTNSSKCICIRKGEVGQLLEVQSLGWWKMCVEGVVGWTPGEFWDMLQDDQEDAADNLETDRSRHSSFGDELWYYGKMSRQKCEELMLRSAKELDYLIRESTQKFASFVLSVKYGGRIRHFPIELTPSGRYVIGKHAFDGLTEIVTFYKQNALFYTQYKEPVSLGDSFRGM